MRIINGREEFVDGGEERDWPFYVEFIDGGEERNWSTYSELN